MKHDVRSGLTPLWLVVLAAALAAILSAGIPLAIGSMGVRVEAWIGFWGSVISALITVVATVGGALAAWLAIKRQVRVSLVAREEERMEKELPRIRRAEAILSDFVEKARSLDGDIAQIFNDQSGIVLSSRKRIPTTRERIGEVEAITRYELGDLYATLAREYRTTRSLRIKKSEAHQNLILNEGTRFAAFYYQEMASIGQQLDEAGVRYFTALAQVEIIASKLAQRAKLYEYRLPRFREELEAYFDDRSGF